MSKPLSVEEESNYTIFKKNNKTPLFLLKFFGFLAILLSLLFFVAIILGLAALIKLSLKVILS